MTTFADQPIEDQIAQWRAYLRRRQGVHGPDAEELEGHLRDQLAALTEAGLAGDEAFMWKRGLNAASGLWLALPFAVAVVFANVFPFHNPERLQLPEGQ